MDNIDKKYGVPVKEISCPACGQKYGHHNTKVDKISEECSKCAKKFEYKNIKLVSAEDFIQKTLGYIPFAF